MTYDDLRTALSAYMHRTDPETIANEPTALELARQVLARSFFPELSAVVLPSLAVTAGEATLPDDVGQVDVVLSGGTDLLYKPPRVFARENAAGGADAIFTVVGTTLLLGDVVDTAEVALTYYRTPEPISGTESNWLSESFPDVWLWAAIAEQHRFVQDFDMADAATGQWQAIAARAVDDTRANRGGGSLRMTNRR